MVRRPAPPRLLAAAAAVAVLVTLAPAGVEAASVGFVPVEGTLPGASGSRVGLDIRESRGRFHLTFTNPSTAASSSLKIAFERDLIEALGRPVELTGRGASFTDRTGTMPRQPGRLAAADWESVGTLLGAKGLDPAHGLRNVELDSLTVTFVKRGVTMADLLTRLRTVGSRIGVILAHGHGEVVAMTTYLEPDAVVPPAPPMPPAPPRLPVLPPAVPTPAAAAIGLGLLAGHGLRRRRQA